MLRDLIIMANDSKLFQSMFKKIDSPKNSPFDKIIYTLKSSPDLIIEDVESNKIYKCSANQINKIIAIKTNATDWIQLPDKSFVRLNNKEVNQIFPLIEEEYRMVQLKFYFEVKNRETQFRVFKEMIEKKIEMKNINNSKFRLTVNKQSISLQCELPLFKTYINFGTHNLTHNNSVHTEEMFISYKGIIYKYPYGNVSRDNKPCFNENKAFNKNGSLIDLKDYYFSILVNKSSNLDYAYHLPMKSSVFESVPIFDINEIEFHIKNNYAVNLIDCLYYLSIKDPNHIIDGILTPMAKTETKKIIFETIELDYKLQKRNRNLIKVHRVFDKQFKKFERHRESICNIVADNIDNDDNLVFKIEEQIRYLTRH
jgi:hypothetical protein